jgi:hypothetical protein
MEVNPNHGDHLHIFHLSQDRMIFKLLIGIPQLFWLFYRTKGHDVTCPSGLEPSWPEFVDDSLIADTSASFSLPCYNEYYPELSQGQAMF